MATTLKISFGEDTYLLNKQGFIQLVFSNEKGDLLEHSIITINQLLAVMQERTNGEAIINKPHHRENV